MIKWKNSLLLFLTATIWGFAFIAQSMGMDHVGPFTFNFVRNVIGGLVLLPCIRILDKLVPRGKNAGTGGKNLWLGGSICGVLLCAATNLQQVGILYTSVGKAGFITALYIVMVPILGLFIGRKCGIQVWISVAVALAGFYLLSVTDGFCIEPADTYLLGAALLFSMQILTIDYFSPKVDCVRMACIQFLVCGTLSGILALLYETITLSGILAAKGPILFAGVLSCGVAYTLQMVGQKNFNPTIASLIMSLEAVISALAGWAILHEALSIRELSGCALIFCAILLAQIPIKATRMG